MDYMMHSNAHKLHAMCSSASPCLWIASHLPLHENGLFDEYLWILHWLDTVLENQLRVVSDYFLKLIYLLLSQPQCFMQP